MAQAVKDLYNRLAIITGFPVYTNATDTPDTTRLLLQVLSDGLQGVIDNLYISNNVLQRTDTIITMKDQDLYGISGIIKNLQLIDELGKAIRLPYNDIVNPNMESEYIIEKDEETGIEKKIYRNGKPVCYVISNGYLKLLPMPDKEYTIKATLSTTDLVWADNNEARDSIEDIEDIILADRKFCDLVVLRAAALLFMRAANNNSQIYTNLFNERLATYLEHDIKTSEAQRGFIRRAGHYDPRRGLLD